MTRIEREKQTIKLMVEIYCKKKHGTKGELCAECREFLEYAHKRLSFCKFEKKNQPVQDVQFTVTRRI